MSLTIWYSWEGNRTEGEVKAENQHKRYKKLAVSEEMQQFVLNSYGCFGKSILRKYDPKTETTKALKSPTITIWM